jgi:hypothetical protein
MSEWIDFGLYSLQAVLLWIVLPRWGAGFVHPAALRDQALPHRSATWTRLLQAWGVLTVLALLAYRLGKVPPPLSADRLHRQGWDALLVTSNLMLALGLLPGAFSVVTFQRWLKTQAIEPAPAEEAFPPTRDDFLPRRLQTAVYAITLAALVARPFAGFVRPDRVHDIWGNFFMGLLIALLLFFTAAGSLARQPNQLDRALGARYRQLEVRACYLLMASLALLELGGLALELANLGSRRYVALLVAAFVSTTLASLMLFPRAQELRSAARQMAA